MSLISAAYGYVLMILDPFIQVIHLNNLISCLHHILSIMLFHEGNLQDKEEPH